MEGPHMSKMFIGADFLTNFPPLTSGGLEINYCSPNINIGPQVRPILIHVILSIINWNLSPNTNCYSPVDYHAAGSN